MKIRAAMVLVFPACALGTAERNAAAQDAQLTGRVVDRSGGALIGAAVMVSNLDREYRSAQSVS